MRYMIPDYYREFRCIADKCPSTCCAGWQIAIDPVTLKKYRRTGGPFGSRLHNSINWKEKRFRQYGGDCAFLNEKGLCDIYSEAGPDMLCRTCRRYPRHTEEYEDIREISLSMSCPEAVRIALGRKEPLGFLTFEKEGDETFDEFDNLLYDKILDVRDLMFCLLKLREIPFGLRLSMVLALGHDVQTRIDQRAVFEIDQVVVRYMADDAPERFARRFREVRSRAGNVKNIFGIFHRLEVLNRDWPAYIKKIEKILYHEEPDNREEFKEAMAGKYGPVEFDIQCEHMAVYFLYVYFCGGVYDGDVYTKVKFAIMGIVWIKEMARALFTETGKVPETSEFEKIVWRYCKEIEHSDVNLNRIMEELSDEKKYNLESMMALL